ncbi:MAG: NAD(P)H-quinone oxidoreductase [Lentisphaeria bacterium]|nr:NAD(P)H-quinone oxidoreductase [Lentisphaeria bacterium]
MKAVVIGTEKNLYTAEVPAPVLKPGYVLIDIHAAGVNRADLLQVDGNYPPPEGWPEWPGLECSGVIAATSENSRFKRGDKVCALLGGGGYAEQVAVPEELVMPMPENCSFVKAAAIPEVFATAMLNLVKVGDLQPNETLFMQAGASGLGLAVIQLAKLMGAKVVTTVSSEAKAEAARAAGADVVINRRTENVPERLKEHPIDLAIDCAAGEILGECLEAMKRGGRWIVIATLGGSETKVSLRTFMKLHISLMGSTLRSRTNAQKGEILRLLEEKLWSLFANGTIAPVIDKVFSMDDAAAAHQVLRDQANMGKVILTVPGKAE